MGIVKYGIYALVASLLITGCNIINPAEKTPTYIRIDSVQFINPNPQATGTGVQKITSAWIYFNNQAVGVFDIPGIIPVLADGHGKILINPGITYAGLKNYQVMYPFFDFDSMSITPGNGQIISFTPKVSYLGTTKFRFIEDFEVGNKFIPAATGTSDTSIVQITKSNEPSKIFEGNGSGYIYLTTGKSNCEIIGNTDFSLPQGEAYIELNYKCTVDFAVELEITAADGKIYIYPVAGVKANENWNKFYVGLRDVISTYSTYNPKAYRVMIQSTLPAGQTNGYVLLDNIKVVSF